MFRKLKETLLGKGPDDAPACDAGPMDPQVLVGATSHPSDEIVRQLQDARGSHVIGLIHRHLTDREPWEHWFFDAMIGEHHLQDFMAAIARVPSQGKLDIVLHSVGGFSLAVQQIARAIRAHKGETTIFVPHYAHHFATLIALAGDRLVMGPAATLSFIEPADGVLAQVVRQKGARRAQDITLIRAAMARNFGRELRAFAGEITQGRGSSRLVRDLVGGKRSPWDPLTAADARKLGLDVSTTLPDELYRLLQACRAAPARDQGVRTVDRSLSARSMSLLQSYDLETCVMHGAALPVDLVQRPGGAAVPPAPRSHGDEDADEGDDAHGVSLESCDLTLRPLIARMEAARGSRVLCIIHQAGMESSSVDTITAEDVMTALQSTPADKPLDIILHTPGGYSYQAHQIALAVKAHRGRKTVFVPYFAMSGGTVISLAADEIVLAPHAVLGPIDSQFPVAHLRRMVPARAVLDLVATKPRRRIHDELLELAIECKRTIENDHKAAVTLMRGTYPAATAERIAHTLNDGTLSHGFPVTMAFARRLGLKVSGDMPAEAVDIVRAYRRNRWGKRSVVFCG
jgi:ClpP class serine protease